MRTNRLRIVFDTNVLVSAALFPESLPGRALELTGSGADLIISVETLTELDNVLKRSRFQRYIGEIRRLDFLEALQEIATLVEVIHSVTACRDPRDDKFLELALSGIATHIVSGDQDLLALNPFQGIPIITPRSFIDLQASGAL